MTPEGIKQFLFYLWLLIWYGANLKLEASNPLTRRQQELLRSSGLRQVGHSLPVSANIWACCQFPSRLLRRHRLVWILHSVGHRHFNADLLPGRWLLAFGLAARWQSALYAYVEGQGSYLVRIFS